MSNPFYHMQLNTADADRARRFYGELFPWQLQTVPMPDGEYTMVQAGDGCGGGIRQNASDAIPSHWLAYVEVADVKQHAVKARDLGATVVQDVTAVEGMGKFAILTDPTGAAFGMWENA